MAEDRRFDAGFLIAGFVVGSITISVVVLLLAKAFAALRGPAQGQLQGNPNPINIYNVGNGGPGGYGYPALPQAPPYQTQDDVSLTSRANTYTLSPTRSVRVFTAPRSGPVWRVQIRVIGPAGGYGIFALDQPVPDGPNSNLDMGSPQGFIVPAAGLNGTSEIYMGPRQILYAKAGGTECDVQVSIIASASV